jgi:DNA primase
MDLVLSHQAGVHNTVASSGTALTDLHIKTLQKISNRIIVAYDADTAGQKAAKRSAELSLALGLEVKIAKIPEGEDPASIIKKSESDWRNILKSAKDAVTSALEAIMGENLKGVALAKKINSEVLPMIYIIENDMIKAEYISIVARKTGIPEEAIISEVKKIKTKPALDQVHDNSMIEPLHLTPLELLCGIILSLGDRQEIVERLENVAGKGIFDEIINNGELNRETLIFEAERRLESLDRERAISELLERVEREVLRKRFEQLAGELDREKDAENLEKQKNEMKELSERLSKLSK